MISGKYNQDHILLYDIKIYCYYYCTDAVKFAADVVRVSLGLGLGLPLP